MKNSIHRFFVLEFQFKLKYAIALAGIFFCFRMSAQTEDKSYLKLSDPASKTPVDNFIPNSKYGLTVTPGNLPEALKNPALYKSARFSNASLTVFPEEIFLFPNLEEVDVSGNFLTVLSTRLSELKDLKELHVNKNRLTSLSTEITSCSKLEVIQIQHNPLEKISKEIGKMYNLREITIGEIAGNCVIPIEIWSLSDLTKLRITDAFLTEIPAAVSGLKHLKELCLANNLITQVPEGLYSLKSIIYLNFGNNKINSLSPAIKALENLEYLGVYYNPIASLPEEVGSLKKLTYLSCWESNLPASEIEKVKIKLPATKVYATESDIH